MKNILFYAKQCLWICGACVIWGLFFPDFAFTPDICKTVYEDAEEELSEEEINGNEMFYRLLQAEPEEIRIKSRLADVLEAFWKRIRNDEE